MNSTDIQQKYLNKERTRCEIFQCITDRCFYRLQSAIGRNQMSLQFKIPVWIFGFPRYSIPDCQMYLLDTLRDKGYRAQSFKDGWINIQWSHLLPDRTQVQESVRNEHMKRIQTPRNQKAIIDTTSWLKDGPLQPVSQTFQQQQLQFQPIQKQIRPIQKQIIRKQQNQPKIPYLKSKTTMVLDW